MSVNHSSPHDDRPQASSSNSSHFDPLCLDRLYVSFHFTSIVLLLPPSLLILYVGVRQRSSAAAMNHCDFFTYNMAVTELMGVVGNTISIYSSLTGKVGLKMVGVHVESYLWSARMLFPILSCVDLYLGAVHPIIYLRLRRGGGVHIRNICAACIWLQGAAGHAFIQQMADHADTIMIVAIFQMVAFLIIMLYCSLSVLWVLIRPLPGEAGGAGLRIHRSKRRAVRSLLVIIQVLFLRFAGGLVCSVLLFRRTASCWLTVANGWLSLPGSLVLLLQFLHRAARRQDVQSG